MQREDEYQGNVFHEIRFSLIFFLWAIIWSDFSIWRWQLTCQCAGVHSSLYVGAMHQNNNKDALLLISYDRQYNRRQTLKGRSFVRSPKSFLWTEIKELRHPSWYWNRSHQTTYRQLLDFPKLKSDMLIIFQHNLNTSTAVSVSEVCSMYTLELKWDVRGWKLHSDEKYLPCLTVPYHLMDVVDKNRWI